LVRYHDDGSWNEVLDDMLRRAHVIGANELTAATNAACRPLGIEVTVYVADREQRALNPLPTGVRGSSEPRPVEGTLAGLAFALVEVRPDPDEGGRPRLWVPVLDGTERVGVLAVELPPGADTSDPALHRRCTTLASLLGHLVMSKTTYGDTVHVARRTEAMSVASELLWQMLPALTVSSDRLVVSGVLAPCYHVGGDAFDYALDAPDAHLAVFDAMGHSLDAGLMCAVVLAATRNARRQGLGLCEMGRNADRTLVDQFGQYRFVTGVLAHLDQDTGLLRYINAGHPPPLVLRGDTVVNTLDRGRRLPLGLTDARTEVAEESLQPGDRILFYSDGVIEARHRDGSFFGLDRLVDLLQRNAAAGLPAPETLRRLSHAVLDYQQGVLQDDATLLLVEWRTGGEGRLLRAASG
jgi:sigma-B regulation protein RsbU (phosphoserine phosphatase)